jgi:hypothetical protein
MSKSNIDMNSYVLRSVDSTVDVESTIEKFRFDLQTYISESERDANLYARAINAVFDQHIGIAITIPTLQNLALSYINTNEYILTTEEYGTLGEKISNYVRNSTSFLIVKGKHGGVRRVSDIPIKNDKEKK